MSRPQSEIVAEIQDLCRQYKAEVPGRSQAWPKSIKERVAELHALGLGDTEVSKLVPISMQTIYSWRHSKIKKALKAKCPGFLPVKINDSPTVTVKGRPRKKIHQPKVSTVTVTTPSGYRVEGLDVDSAVRLLSEIELWR
jgi:hypothetical protein